MTATTLDGKAILGTIKEELRQRVAVLVEHGVVPGLGTVLVGDDPGSQWYVGAKHRDCAEIGIRSLRRDLPAGTPLDEVLAVVHELNDDPECTGFIVQQPTGLDENAILSAVDPAKDVDGLHPTNLGWLVLGHPAPLPCTPVGCIELLRRYDVPIAGAKVVVVGRGITVGRPLGLILTRKSENATVTLCHTGTRDLAAEVRQADIVVAAAGVPGIITADMVKPGAAVLDVGVSRVLDPATGKSVVAGDVAPDVWDVAGFVSPNPGGVGPMTRAMLLSNVVEAAERSLAESPAGVRGLTVAASARTTTLVWRVLPAVALLALVATWGRDIGIAVVVLVALLLAGAVLAAVHHAEVVAHRVGEPFGSLVLAVAVTVIEVSLIVTLMLSGGDEAATLARETVFAAVMITINGILGLSLLMGARRFGTVRFNAEGTGGALATVATLATVCLVLPTVTESQPGPEFTSAQLAFAAVASLALYLAFVVTQTVRHRDFFLPVSRKGATLTEDDHADPPTTREAYTSLGFLVLSLVAVVGLAKIESPAIEDGVLAVGLPVSFVGVVIALLVLLPETIAAVNAARRDRIQTSLNLAMGSAMASIGLTIPTLAVASIWIPTPLHLGLGATQIVLLAITVVVAVLTVVPGRATRLQASVHLTLFAAFLFLAMSP